MTPGLIQPWSMVVKPALGWEKPAALHLEGGGMVRRSARHTECVAYLLAHGADVYAQNSRGDNALHIAAKNGSAGALHALLSFRPHADGEDGSQLLGEIIVQGDAGPTRFIDLHNGRPHGRPATCRDVSFAGPTVVHALCAAHNQCTVMWF